MAIGSILSRFQLSFCLALLLAAGLPAQAGDDWEPITPEELALQDDPLNPGAHAVILYRAQHTSHADMYDERYYRIKILTDEGKEHADVEIPFFKGASEVKDLEARVIQPDGTVVPFQGTVFDKTLYSRKRLRRLAKTFTFPQVEVGSIVEYRYKLDWKLSGLRRVLEEMGPPPFGLSWTVQGELSLLRGDFRVQGRGAGPGVLHWNLVNLPQEIVMKNLGDGWWGFTVENIPAFKEEKFMPPEGIYAMGAHFYYPPPWTGTGERFWFRVGKERHQGLEDFIRDYKQVRREATRLTAGAVGPEEELRRLYARAQKIHNLSYEERKTQKEEKREKRKTHKNVKDVLQRGYGYSWQINALFIALARAAGFQAESVRIVTRDERLFRRNIEDWDQFNDELVWVRLVTSTPSVDEEKDLYLDPGNPFAPYGLLAWEQTGIEGLRLDKDGGLFVTLPSPESKMAVFERRASVQVEEDGTLSGTVTVKIHGLGGMTWREELYEEDDVKRREETEKWIKDSLPAGAVVEITSMSGWEQNDQPLAVEALVRVPDFAISTARRLFLPTGIFQTKDKVRFEHAQRQYPVYFRFPWEERDLLELTRPEGFGVEALPEEKHLDTNTGRYQVTCGTQGETLRIQRELVVRWLYFSTDAYPALRDFFNQVKGGDEQYAIFRTETVAQQD